MRRLSYSGFGFTTCLLFALTVTGVRGQTRPAAIDSASLIADVRALSADSMEGRRTGTAGSVMAQRYLDAAFRQAGLRPVGSSFRHTFELTRDSARFQAVNFVGMIPGRDTSRVIVISAHYDHLGRRGADIFNGADDNASGVGGILAFARAMAAGPQPEHTMLFVAFDAEESGLRGARAFVQNPPIPLSRIKLNINLDMISRNAQDELYVAGTHHYPQLLGPMEKLSESAKVKLRIGHDLPGTGSNDWTSASDHGPFHAAGIPFLYFGVEDHADYHKASDDFDRIDPGFLVRAVRTVFEALVMLDASLPG